MQQQEPEVNFEQVVQRIRSLFGGGNGKAGRNPIALFIYGVLAIALIIWLVTGFYTVQPGEEAALRRLGSYESTEGPGLHWFWPAPIGTVAVESVKEVRRLELGLRGTTPVLSESLMITGDENIVDAQLLVQWDIKNLQQFLFRVSDPGQTFIKNASETSLRQVIGQRNIDDVLTTEKEQVQQETKELLQRLLDNYDTGINIREVKLQNVRAPLQVQDAFDDVVRAREDKDRIIRLANAYKADIMPRAEGDAARLRQTAEAFKQEKIAEATGQADRFLAILREYKNSKDVTRQRLFLEAMEDILPGVTKFIVATEGNNNLLQFLPLSNVTTPVSNVNTSLPSNSTPAVP